MFGILGVFGVSVSIVIIAIGSEFFGPLPSILHPSTSADLWTVGQGIRQGTVLNYSLTSEGPRSSLSNAIVSINVVRMLVMPGKSICIFATIQYQRADQFSWLRSNQRILVPQT